MKTRDYQIDNIKGLLIIFVVFGHMLLASLSKNNWLTTLIYSFHMPTFIYLNGLFSKHVTLKKALHYGVLYILVQTLYIFVVKLTNYPWIPESNILVIPIFHVWYLLSLTFWYLFSIIIKKFSLRPIWVLTIVLICAVTIRFVNFGVDGNYFAYARTFVFAPFFLVGYFTSFKQLFQIREKAKSIKPYLLIVLAMLFALNFFVFEDNAKEWMRLFFGYVNYQHFSDSHFIFFVKEIIQYLIGGIIIFVLLGIVPSNKGILNFIGQHTLTIFICHPVIYFIIYNVIEKSNPVDLKPVIVSLILTIIAVIWSLVVERLLQISIQFFRRKSTNNK